MTKTEAIKKIRKACIAANPEIMELKFGCRFKNPEGMEMIFIRLYDRLGLSAAQFMMCESTDNVYAVMEHSLDRCENLGREIRLADVLKAVGYELGDDFGIDADGYFIFRNSRKSGTGLYAEWNDDGSYKINYWDLKKDNLEEQSKKTILLLTSLLPE